MGAGWPSGSATPPFTRSLRQPVTLARRLLVEVLASLSLQVGLAAEICGCDSIAGCEEEGKLRKRAQ